MKNINPKIIISVVLIIIAIVLGAVFLFGNNLLNSGNGNQNEQSNITQSPSPTSANNELSPTIINDQEQDESQVPQNWEIYNSDIHDFSIKHPPDINIEQRERNALRFTKWGPTQTEGTELFDAISLTFNSGSLNNETLQSFVESKIEEERNSPVSEVSSELKTVTLSNMTGYEFSVRGLGEFKHIYLPNGSDKYLWIVDGTEDPNDQGFTETVERMLSTLETGI